MHHGLRGDGRPWLEVPLSSFLEEALYKFFNE